MFNFSEFKEKIKGVEEWLQKDLSTIRTGRAAPAILDGLQVEAYGQKMNIRELANISLEDAKTVKVEPWDQGVSKAIEKAIVVSSLGLSVAPFERGLRIIFPELTSERRDQFIKLVKTKLEEARVSLRGLRDKTLKEIDDRQKSGSLSEDDKFRLKDDLQKIMDEANRKLEEVALKKETELKS